MGFFNSPYPVVHIARQYDRLEVDPDTGNEILVEADPVVRYAQEVSQGGKNSSTDVMSGEFLNRVNSELIMCVDNPEVYSTDDQVIIDPVIEGGEYVTGTGTAYWVDGDPSDQRRGPWPMAFVGFGGVVMLKRVT